MSIEEKKVTDKNATDNITQTPQNLEPETNTLQNQEEIIQKAIDKKNEFREEGGPKMHKTHKDEDNVQNIAPKLTLQEIEALISNSQTQINYDSFTDSSKNGTTEVIIITTLTSEEGKKYHVETKFIWEGSEDGEEFEEIEMSFTPYNEDGTFEKPKEPDQASENTLKMSLTDNPPEIIEEIVELAIDKNDTETTEANEENLFNVMKIIGLLDL